MPRTVENQRWFRINRTSLKNNFLQVAHSDWMGVNRNEELGPFGLQLYLYLAGNANGYEFALSPQAAREQAGIKETSFRKYLKLLEKHGYIVWRRGNVYDFYTSPRPEDERTDPDHHETFINFDDAPDAQESALQPILDAHGKSMDASQLAPQALPAHGDMPVSHGEATVSPGVQNPSPLDTEIDNIYTDNANIKDSITDNAGEPPTPPASAAGAAPATTGNEIVVTIPPPKSKYIEKLEKEDYFRSALDACKDPITGDFIF